MTTFSTTPSASPTSTQVITFGCRLNAYEAEVMRTLARESGLENAVIVNTCAVTAEAERQARQAIRKARRERPGARIIVTGCAAQIRPEVFAAMDEVDEVIGNAEKLDPRSFVEPGARVRVNDIMSVRETALHLVSGFHDRARAFVQVQNGCDHRCTFCIIPYGRGPSRSVPMGEIARQIDVLVHRGYREVVLTGVDITSYGTDLPGRPRLGDMMRRVLRAVPGLERLRVSSLDPVEVDEALWDLIAHEPRLMPHLHLSLQSGDDLILKRMKRRHSRDDALRFCARARALRPDIAFGADIIAGFPTETEAMFENTLNLVGECGLTFLHVFPYSARAGTPAARMPQVPPRERRERARRLRRAGDAALRRFLAARLGKEESLLIETTADGISKGRSAHYVAMTVAGRFAPGTVVTARAEAVVETEGGPVLAGIATEPLPTRIAV